MQRSFQLCMIKVDYFSEMYKMLVYFPATAVRLSIESCTLSCYITIQCVQEDSEYWNLQSFSKPYDKYFYLKSDNTI